MKKRKENLMEDDRMDQHPKLQKTQPPDGGWGWLVVFGSCFNNIFNLSFIIVFGLVYGDMIKDMGEGTKGSSLVVNIGLLVSNSFGPLSGMLIKATSYRVVAVFGSLLAAFSVIASAYSTTLWHMIVVFGFFRGVGLCMVSSSSFVAMNSYFKKNRGKAIGFSAVGAGIGQSVMPYVVRFFMDEYQFKGTVLLMGALCLNGVAGVLLYHPVEWYTKKYRNDSSEEKKFLSNNLNHDKHSSGIGLNILVAKESSLAISNHEKKGSCKNSRLKSIWLNLVSSMDLTLLKDWRFVIVITGNALAFASVVNFVMLTPFLMKDLLKLDGSQTALVLSVLSGSDVVGRIVVPTITDKLRIKATHSIIFACILIAIVRQIMTCEIGLTTTIILSMFHGLGKTLFILNQNISVADNCHQDQVPSAVGLYMLAKGVIVLPFGYFAGWIRDYSGDFLICIAVLNSMLLLVAVMLITSISITYFVSKRTNNVTNIL